MDLMAEQLNALRAAFGRFHRVLDAATIPCQNGRRVDGIPHAVAISEATQSLYVDLVATHDRLHELHGTSSADYIGGITVEEADSPDGPWTTVPPPSVRMTWTAIGGDGADARLMAALESAARVAGFPAERWNAVQARRPGASTQRWRSGDTIGADDLARLKSAARMLDDLGSVSQKVAVDVAPPDLVTLDQVAAFVSLSKRSLERYTTKRDWPDPDVRGGGGKPNRWYWVNLRPALQKYFRPDVPERFPASRFTG